MGEPGQPNRTRRILPADTEECLERGAENETLAVVLYTINHAEDDVILISSELLPLLEQIRDRVNAGKKLVLLNDTGKPAHTVQTSLSFDAEYQASLAAADPRRDFPELDESTRATWPGKRAWNHCDIQPLMETHRQGSD